MQDNTKVGLIGTTVVLLIIAIIFIMGNDIMDYAKEQGKTQAQVELTIKQVAEQEWEKKNLLTHKNYVQIVYPTEDVRCAVIMWYGSYSGIDCDWNYKP